MIEEIPNSWKFVSFGDVIDFITDYQANGSFATLKENVQYYNAPNYAVLVRLKDLRTSMKTYSQFIYTDERGYNFLKKSRVQEGDILVANVGSVGVTLKMPNVSFKATLAPNMFRVDLNSNYSKQLFLYYTKSAKYWEELKKAAGGSTSQPKINKSQYRSILIPLPPLPEQQRIVAKIEELFSELDKGIETLKTAQQQLKVYRQAVLKYAFEGRLTNPNVKEGELPEGWESLKSGDLMDFINSGSTPASEFLSDNSGDIPFLKVYNLNFDGTLNHTKNPVFVKKSIHENKMKRSKCIPNDVLINIVGPPLGKVSIVSKHYPEWNINQAIVAFRPNAKILCEFLSYHLQNQVTIQWLENTSKATAGQWNVKVSTCREIPLNVPIQIDEQKRVVQEIESRLSVCDKIEESIEQGLQQAEALRQSILKKAFEGKLVPQDPNDEPASILLERIKAERAASQPEKKTKTKKVKA